MEHWLFDVYANLASLSRRTPYGRILPSSISNRRSRLARICSSVRTCAWCIDIASLVSSIANFLAPRIEDKPIHLLFHVKLSASFRYLSGFGALQRFQEHAEFARTNSLL